MNNLGMQALVAAMAGGAGKEQELDEFQTPGSTVGSTGVPSVGQGQNAPPPGQGGPMQVPITQAGMQQMPANVGSGSPQYGSLEAAQLNERGNMAGIDPFTTMDHKMSMQRQALGKEKAFQTDLANKQMEQARKDRKGLSLALGGAFGLDPSDPRGLRLAQMVEADVPDDMMKAALAQMGLTPDNSKVLREFADMPAEVKTKVALTSGAARLVNESLPYMFDEDGNFSWSSGIYGQDANRARISMRRGMKNALRAVSGAAIPDSEIEEEVEKVMPKVGDTSATARAKIAAFQSDINDRLAIQTYGYELPEQFAWSIETPYAHSSAAGEMEGAVDEGAQEALRRKYMGAQ